MHLHEHQAKDLLRGDGIPVPAGGIASSAAEARAVAQGLGAGPWVIKAQVHAGGRGKAGGVRLVDELTQVETAAREILDRPLVTAQTGAGGQPVSALLVEQASVLAAEYYLGMLVDRESRRVVVIASASGGMDIEEVAATRPESVLRLAIHPVVGLQPYQCRRVAFALGLEGKTVGRLVSLMQTLYRWFLASDLGLLEINPLALTQDGELLALDAKVDLDDNALYRHPDLAGLRDPSQEDEKESRAREHGLNYIALDGDIACMVNGAGLAMATMDLIKLHGGEPANFLDVGGGTTAERVAEAFKLILSDPKVRAVLVNIFGGIVRCDLIAEGIIAAVREVGIHLPMVVRLEGTRVEEGLRLLEGSGLDLLTAEDLTDAARRAVAAADR